MSGYGIFWNRSMSAAIALAVIALLIALAGEPARDLLQWSRPESAAGEWWRFLTAHIVHLDVAHAALNVAVLLALAVLFGGVYSPTRHAANAFVGIVIIDIGLIWLGDLDWYVGLSGVLHALAAAAVARLIIERHDPFAWGLAIFGLGKILYENVFGAMPFTATDTHVVIDAHLFGVLAGMVTGLFPADRATSARLSDGA